MLKLTFKQELEAAIEFETLDLADLDRNQLEAIEAAAHTHLVSGAACPTESAFTVEVDGEKHEGHFLGEYYLGWDSQAESSTDEDENPVLYKTRNDHWSNPLRRGLRWFPAEEVEGNQRFLVQAKDKQDAAIILAAHPNKNSVNSNAWIVSSPETLHR